MISEDQAKEIVKELVAEARGQFIQELVGESEDPLDRALRHHMEKVARHSWKISQKWCKWDDDGPVLMPNNTRIYYRKGRSEIVLQEFPPQVRLLKFSGGLAHKNNSIDDLDNQLKKIHHFSLSLPYVVFIFKFTDGLLVKDKIKCAFLDRPLKNLSETPLIPYLSNIDGTLRVCLGHTFDDSKLVKDNLSQQIAYTLDNFWNTSYNEDWSKNFWDIKKHFQDSDPRLASLQAWEEATYDNSLFVVEDVDWPAFGEENFGDIIVSLLSDDKNDAEYNEDLYLNLVESFFEDIKNTYDQSLSDIEERLAQQEPVSLVKKLMGKLQEVD